MEDFFSDKQITENVPKKPNNKLLSIQGSTVTPKNKTYYNKTENKTCYNKTKL